MIRREGVAALLRAYTPIDGQERLHTERMLDLLTGPADPFSRSSTRPGHFTASAFLISPERDSILLIFHKKLKRWLQPGGHLESSDAGLAAAASRELREETGFAVNPETATLLDVDVHRIPTSGSEPEHEHFDVRFEFQSVTPVSAVGVGDHVMRWVPLTEVQQIESDASVMRAVAKLLR